MSIRIIATAIAALAASLVPALAEAQESKSAAPQAVAAAA